MKNLLILILFLINLSTGYAQKIFDYINHGEVEKVQFWLNKNQDEINNKFSRGNDLGIIDSLHIIEYAAFYNKKEILNLFIQNKELFEDFRSWISDALGASIHNCDIETLKMLLDAGADINGLCKMCNQAPPIAIAITYNCFDTYQFLIENGAKLINENSGYDVIHAAALSDSLKILKNLVEEEFLDVNQEDQSWKTNATFYAATKNLANLKYIIEKGGNYTITDSEGYSILYYAGNLEIFKFLENLLINENGKNIKDLMNQKTMLFTSIISKDEKDLFDYFVNKYPSYILPSDSSDSSDNPLFCLLETEYNTEYFFYELMKRKFDLKMLDEDGFDIKFYAKKMKKTELLELIKNFEKNGLTSNN